MFLFSLWTSFSLIAKKLHAQEAQVLHLRQAAPDVAVQPEQAFQQEQDHPEEAEDGQSLQSEDCCERRKMMWTVKNKFLH